MRGGSISWNPGVPTAGQSYRYTGPTDSTRTPAHPQVPRSRPHWAGTHPLEQEADGLNLSKGRGPDEGGEAALIWLVDEVVTWQEGVIAQDCTPAHFPQRWGTGRRRQLGSDEGGVGEAHVYTSVTTLYTSVERDTWTLTGHVSTHMDTPAHEVRQAQINQCMGMGTPFLRCSFSWLSSPWAASWWMDRAGARET